jgi:hypothetical protein
VVQNSYGKLETTPVLDHKVNKECASPRCKDSFAKTLAFRAQLDGDGGPDITVGL